MCTGNCGLCGEDKKLVESHILSKFLYDIIKKQSATKKFRTLENPKIRQQDGLKVYLLCKDCELLLSKYENIFSKQHKAVISNKAPAPFTYTTASFIFLISLGWRATLYILRFKKDEYQNQDIAHLVDVEKKLREYLLGEKPLTNIEVNLIPVFENQQTDELNFICQYSVGYDIFFFNKSKDTLIIIVFTNMILCINTNPDKLTNWAHTCIYESGGTAWSQPTIHPEEINILLKKFMPPPPPPEFLAKIEKSLRDKNIIGTTENSDYYKILRKFKKK